MIYAISTCSSCPFYIADDSGNCTGRFPEKRVVDVDAQSTKPDWCPLASDAIRVMEGETNTTGLPGIPVTECDGCPFFYENGKRRCNIANPKGRPILTDEPRPVWCSLNKEVVVVR